MWRAILGAPHPYIREGVQEERHQVVIEGSKATHRRGSSPRCTRRSIGGRLALTLLASFIQHPNLTVFFLSILLLAKIFLLSNFFLPKIIVDCIAENITTSPICFYNRYCNSIGVVATSPCLRPLWFRSSHTHFTPTSW